MNTTASPTIPLARTVPPMTPLVTVANLAVALLSTSAETSRRLRALLGRECQFIPCESPIDVVRCLGTGQIDLVLVDEDLTALLALRGRPELLYVPLVALAASPSAAARALESGAAECLSLEDEPAMLHARLHAQLRLKRRMEVQQQTISHLKSAFERKDTLMRIATHDLKNPLNNIKLAHYYLRTLLADRPELAEALDTIETTVASMNDLIVDFLDTSALESGRTQLSLAPVPIEDAVWDVMCRYGAAANRKSITLLMGETSGVAYADYKRLLQIISNLVSNAIKYSPPESFITISAAVQNGWTRITIADQGPGVPEDKRSALFEPFSRLGTPTTGGESSSGLGLWIVRELAAIQGGRVGLDCPAEGGSIFWVELPVFSEEMLAAV